MSLFMNAERSDNSVFPILYWINLIRIIQLESVKHDRKLLKAFMCLPLTELWLFGAMVMTPD